MFLGFFSVWEFLGFSVCEFLGSFLVDLIRLGDWPDSDAGCRFPREEDGSSDGGERRE